MGITEESGSRSGIGWVLHLLHCIERYSGQTRLLFERHGSLEYQGGLDSDGEARRIIEGMGVQRFESAFYGLTGANTGNGVQAHHGASGERFQTLNDHRMHGLQHSRTARCSEVGLHWDCPTAVGQRARMHDGPKEWFRGLY